MSKINTPNLTSFDRGILRVFDAKDLGKIQLPELAHFHPSDAKIEARLPKLWKALSLENIMHESFNPLLNDKNNLNPAIYQKRLQNAKKAFQKLAEESRDKNKKKKKQYPADEEEDEIFDQVAKDLDELEQHQDLLWMLRQVVHIA